MDVNTAPMAETAAASTACPVCHLADRIVEIPRAVPCGDCGVKYSAAEPTHRCLDFTPGRLLRCMACRFLFVVEGAA